LGEAEGMPPIPLPPFTESTARSGRRKALLVVTLLALSALGAGAAYFLGAI
jgi:hypothetical protein